MKSIKFNADYESVLFSNRPAPVINQALEFLAFFVDERPLITSKKYTEEYLGYVEAITGRKPVLKKEGQAENFWGKLVNLPLEKKLNSKIESSKFIIDQKWCDHTYIIHSLEELNGLDDRLYLAKNPFGMSGQNFVTFNKCAVDKVEPLLKYGAVIVEPFFDRKYDFSHYVFPDGKKICYQNLVDGKFQYRGTLFNNYQNASIENLGFYSEISKTEWDKFQEQLESIISFYRAEGAVDGFSIDSFVYLERGELKIRAMSEINYRRTMGLVCYLLAEKFATTPWCAFLLAKATQHKVIPVDKTMIQLSPGDSRYEMYFLSASDRENGKKRFVELKELLPDCQFPVEL
ncbi:hypothetical protein [Peredibacter starrii]|uniref:ATP-grasp domain-containing protein n=1 Tax=Peredibacter starrii TaxID=28202 RepID=A0AAX4HSS4_9BACT|nr:hypothetical protein [Peredibacter starrii]WPU65964.1 hypothetical protein SOO65_04325 [Peredibacter starrii]